VKNYKKLHKLFLNALETIKDFDWDQLDENSENVILGNVGIGDKDNHRDGGETDA